MNLKNPKDLNLNCELNSYELCWTWGISHFYKFKSEIWRNCGEESRNYQGETEILCHYSCGEFYLQNQQIDLRDKHREHYVGGECCKRLCKFALLIYFTQNVCTMIYFILYNITSEPLGSAAWCNRFVKLSLCANVQKKKKKPDKFACSCSLENYSYCKKLSAVQNVKPCTLRGNRGPMEAWVPNFVLVQRILPPVVDCVVWFFLM